MNIFKLLGNQGPTILFFESLYLLYEKSNYIMYYVGGYIINFILNILLKFIIQEPRPFINTKLIKLSKKKSTFFVNKDGSLYSIYGMPSGHAQAVMFSLVFIYFVLINDKNQKYYLTSYVIISLLTFYERVKTNVHTKKQVFVGAICGVIIAYICINYANVLDKTILN